MAGKQHLTDLEQLLLLAVIRLGKAAYGAAIQTEIEERARRRVALGSIHVTLARLEEQGLARSRKGDSQPIRGGKARRIYSVTSRGRAALDWSREAIDRMWEGLPA